MDSPSPPTPPSPAAQAQANRDTAVTQQQVNMVDQTTPYGSVNYSQNGKWADGTPRFASTTTLSPEEQRNQNQQWEFDNQVNTLGINQTRRLAGHLDQPIRMGNEAAESRLMELGRARLDPVLTQRRQARETQLYNQGLQPGTEAWSRSMGELGQQENDAYNQLMLTGRGQANQELLTERNQPINEITALMSGGQVTQPSFVSTPQANVQPVDLYRAHELGPYAQWQAQNQSNNAMIGALGGMAGTALGGWGRNNFTPFWRNW